MWPCQRLSAGGSFSYYLCILKTKIYFTFSPYILFVVRKWRLSPKDRACRSASWFTGVQYFTEQVGKSFCVLWPTCMTVFHPCDLCMAVDSVQVKTRDWRLNCLFWDSIYRNQCRRDCSYRFKLILKLMKWWSVVHGSAIQITESFSLEGTLQGIAGHCKS